jgi:hypothetical protein
MKKYFMKMWMLFLILSLGIIDSSWSQDGVPQKGYLQQPAVCGEYKIYGYFREDTENIVVGYTNEDSFSKIKLIPWKKEWYKIAGYLNIPIEFQAKIIKINSRKVYFKDVKNVSFRVENPLNPRMNQGFVWIRDLPCEKD